MIFKIERKTKLFISFLKMSESNEPLSVDDIRQKRSDLLKSLTDNARTLSLNTTYHDEHCLGKIPKDILNDAYASLDAALPEHYFKVRYSKPWNYIFGFDNIVDIYITFPDQEKVKTEIYNDIKNQQALQFSNFFYEKLYSSFSNLYSDFHNYKRALVPKGFNVAMSTTTFGGKVLTITLTA